MRTIQEVTRDLIEAYEKFADALYAQGPMYIEQETKRLNKLLDELEKDHQVWWKPPAVLNIGFPTELSADCSPPK